MTIDFESADFKKARSEMANLLHEMIDGKLGVIACSRSILKLLPRLTDDPQDPDFRTFVGIDSETDVLPVGEERTLWASDALAEKQKEKLGTVPSVPNIKSSIALLQVPETLVK